MIVLFVCTDVTSINSLLCLSVSSWFDTTITACSISKAKKLAKVSKEHEPWLVDDSSGALFTMPNNDEFQRCLDASSPPFVLMQPVDDRLVRRVRGTCFLHVGAQPREIAHGEELRQPLRPEVEVMVAHDGTLDASRIEHER